MDSRPTPVVLCILDGFGHREAGDHNAIAAANTPTFERLRAQYPYGVINASESHVGLPEGQMGNSEVGHMNIGAGRVVMQDLPRIDAAIASGALAQDVKLSEYIAALRRSGGTCHLMGLLSDGGVHSHLAHIAALAKIVAGQGVAVAIHAFLDGRDTPPQSAQPYLRQLEAELAGQQSVRIATVSGRYYAMDRDKRWDRVQRAYAAMVEAKAPRAETPEALVESSYADGITDEFVLPAVIGDYHGMHAGDGLLFANFRADRVRQLAHALLDPAFDGFARTPVSFAAALGLVEYSEAISRWVEVLFPPQELTGILGAVVSEAGLRQLRIAETEKYAHVTFFFNGGREEPFVGEERILVPSPNVATYDLKPEMSAREVTDALVEAIAAERFDLIVVNYANADMVGHSGVLAASIQAVETLDACIARLVSAVEAKGGAMLITADHGNIEELFDPESGQPHTAHTLNLVPFMVIGERFRGLTSPIREGKLADIAPSVLALMGLAKPAAMTGESLLPAAR